MERVAEEIKSPNTCVPSGTIESLHLTNLSKYQGKARPIYSAYSPTLFESFVSFSMIGTGFSADQIKEFGRFFQNTQRYSSKNIPSWLSHPEKSTEVPDVIVKDVRDTVVIEVKASEIVFSRKCLKRNENWSPIHVRSLEMWGAGCTLRFPRFLRFRHDKSWKDAMTYSGKVPNENAFGPILITVSPWQKWYKLGDQQVKSGNPSPGMTLRNVVLILYTEQCTHVLVCFRINAKKQRATKKKVSSNHHVLAILTLCIVGDIS